MRKLALFDLDNTLLGGDSDALWGEYLVERGLVDAEAYGRANQQFYQDYLDGVLDIQAFLRFQLRILGQHPPETLHAWRADYLRQKIEPILLPKAHQLLARHRREGALILIITATNRFITGPIAELYGVEHLIATEPAMRQGRYTGEVEGVPSFAGGKVERFRQWLESAALGPVETWFYSDSHNDLPLLEQVDHPVAVDPDPRLAELARQRAWPSLSLRGDD